MERRGRASWGVVTISQVLFKGVGCQPLQVDGAQWCGARRGLGQWLLETRSQQVWGSSWESSSCKYVAQTCLTRASPPALDRTLGLRVKDDLIISPLEPAVVLQICFCLLRLFLKMFLFPLANIIFHGALLFDLNWKKCSHFKTS